MTTGSESGDSATSWAALRTTPGLDDPGVHEARAELRRQDDYYANERIKWMLRWLVVLWFGSLLIDAVLCFGLDRGSFARAVAHRMIPVPWYAVLAVRIHRGPMLREREVMLGILGIAVFVTLWLAATVVTTGGLVSMFHTVMLFVPLTMIIVPAKFSRSVILLLCVLVTYVTTTLLGVWLDPAIASQLRDRAAWMTFFYYLSTFVGMGTTMAVVSHVLWSLRREIFESKSIGKYRLRRLLGRGGMGEVWASYHAGLRREVALKLLTVREGHATAARRFEREVQAMVRLTHPNTVRVFDFGVAEGGLLYYAMELLAGENLGRLLRREGKLEIARARHFALQAARALAEAHQHGIVHRDVKAENIMIIDAGGERDFVKVLDFGIATTLEDQEAQKLTQTGTVAGTPGTVSPEVIRGEIATPAADVYALGAVTYAMLTGALPFTGDQAAQVLLAHLHDEVVAPSVRRGEPIDPAFEAVVLKCLAKSKDERYADAGALATALADLAVPVWRPSVVARPAADADDANASDARAETTRPLPTMRGQRTSR